MATGAGAEFWGEPALPSVLKHTLLERYVPRFAVMTGSHATARHVVFLDGYAGRGRYADGHPAGAEKILQAAKAQYASSGLAWSCFFVERKPESAAVLSSAVAEYAAAGVTASAHLGDVRTVLDRVIEAATGCPLFVFLDPCGLGLPFDRLAGLMNGPRKPVWPPTEFLLNFSLEAVRRIGGHVRSSQGNENALQRLHESVDGTWWREHFEAGVTAEAVQGLINGFIERLTAATGMHLVSVPVRRAPRHKPVYNLIFGTRKQHGLWGIRGRSRPEHSGLVGHTASRRCRERP